MNIRRGDQDKKKRGLGELLRILTEGVFGSSDYEASPGKFRRQNRSQKLREMSNPLRRRRVLARMAKRSRQINYAKARQ